MDANSTLDDLFPSKYIKSSDLGNKACTVTIKSVDFALVGRENEKKAVISFVESTKKMVLNRTNAATLANLYGKKVSDWINKRITLYAATVAFGAEMRQGIRIKEQIPTSPASIPVASATAVEGIPLREESATAEMPF